MDFRWPPDSLGAMAMISVPWCQMTPNKGASLQLKRGTRWHVESSAGCSVRMRKIIVGTKAAAGIASLTVGFWRFNCRVGDSCLVIIAGW